MAKTKYLFFLVVVLGGLFLVGPKAYADTTLPATISSDVTYSAAGGPYIVSSSVTINAGVTVTFEAGSVIKVSSLDSITVSGTLNASGTSGAPVLFTSTSATPAPGSWGQIKFTGAGTGTFAHTNIEYGGKPSGFEPMVEVMGTSGVSFENVNISNSGGIGFRQSTDVTSTFNNTTFTDAGTQNGDMAVVVWQGTLNLNNVTTSGSYGALECGRNDLGTDGYRPVINIAGGTFSNVAAATWPVIQLIKTCNITGTNVTWPAGDNAFVNMFGNITGDMVLPQFGIPIKKTGKAQDYSITGSLTVPAGTVFKFPQHGGFYVRGVLTVNGTSASPVVFTSQNDDTGGDTNGSATSPAAGDWSDLRFVGVSSLASQSVLSYLEVRYGGTGFMGAPYTDGEIYAGLYSNVAITQLTLGASALARCIYVKDLGLLSVTQSDLSGCNVVALENANTSGTISAENNWWGDATGPLHTTLNPSGLGVQVMGDVDFDPWLNSAAELEPVVESAGRRYTPVVAAILEASSKQIHKGEKVTLSWKVENAGIIRFYPPDGELLVPEGSLEVTPAETTIYKITVTNGDLVAEAEVTLEVTNVDRDPVIIIPGILGSWPQKRGLTGELVLDPVKHIYDDLLATLRLNGYKDGETLFPFPYQWRNSNEITWPLLKAKIDAVKESCKCGEVDLVAHSMGGLVARAYIQGNEFAEDVDQAIFLGTPHLGSPKAYYTWEGGLVWGGDHVEFTLQLIFKIEASYNKYSVLGRYIRDKVKSVAQLLPIDPYLLKESEYTYAGYLPCDNKIYPCNTFLERLAEGESLLYERVRVQNLLVDNQDSTITGIMLQNFSEPTGNWKHGRPVENIFAGGDGTVPTKSASLKEGNIVYSSAISHAYMTSLLRGRVTSLLLDSDGVVLSTPIKPITEMLIAYKHSPIDLEIIDPNGRKIGVNNSEIYEDVYYTGPGEGEFIIITNPESGDYQINAYGTGEGVFDIVLSRVSDIGEIEKVISGEAVAGGTYEFPFKVSPNSIVVDTVKEELVEEKQNVVLTSAQETAISKPQPPQPEQILGEISASPEPAVLSSAVSIPEASTHRNFNKQRFWGIVNYVIPVLALVAILFVSRKRYI